MQIETINLPSSERFPCGKRDIKRSLVDITPLKVTFRHSDMRTPRYADLSFDGIVLANASTSRHWNGAHFKLFPIGRKLYPQSACDEFQESILPKIQTWLTTTLNNQSPETANEEELFVVWNKGTHEIKYIKFKC